MLAEFRRVTKILFLLVFGHEDFKLRLMFPEMKIAALFDVVMELSVLRKVEF